MYEELVKRLTACEDGCSRCPMMYDERVEQDLVREHCAAYEAADALEELSRECESLAKTVNETAEWIRNRNTADVVPVRHGRWIWDKDGMDWNIGAWRCSECKAMSPMWWNTDRTSPMHKSGHYYCPNCGALMDGKSPVEDREG